MGIVSLTTYSNYNSLGNDINIVGTFSGGEPTKFTDKHVSSPIMNYVEAYEYKGVEKTLFYTEVNTNINVGDRVYIVNGNYDSYYKIKLDKYKKGTDGYVVLFVDKCRIVLDIDFTGVLPNNGDVEVGDLMSDYLKVYNIDSYDHFVHANRQLTSRGGYLGGKFDYYQNNIAFIDEDYPEINDGWTRTTGVTASPGFYVREPAYDSNLVEKTKGRSWLNITEQMMAGSFTYSSSLNNPKNEYRYYNNNKFIVMGSGFRFKDRDYVEGTVYYWDIAENAWLPDVTERGYANRAIITKANLRDGNFSGTFYSGVYGNKTKRIKWTGEGDWYGGTLFNTSWISGSMFSRILIEESYKSYLDRNRKPQQKLNTYNNGGYGFNFIIDSDFEKTSIYSAIVRNSRFGMTPSYPVVERHLTGEAQSFEYTLNNGLFESCYFNNTLINGGAVKNSRSHNSVLDGVKHINSWSKNSVLKNSVLISDSIIKIDGYDEWSASEKRGSTIYGATFSDGLDFKVYKFYIGEADFNRLKHGDSFYLRGVRVSNDDSDLLNVFDRRFTIGNWTEYVDDFNSTGAKIDDLPNNTFYKKGIICAAFLVNIEENEWIYNSVRFDVPKQTGINTSGYLTDTLLENPNPRYSIDVFVSTMGTDRRAVSGLNYIFSTQSASSLNYIRPQRISNNIDVTDAYVIDSDIESGVIDNCSWNNGNNINYNNDLVITQIGNTNSISTYRVTLDPAEGQIEITTLGNSLKPEIVDRRSKTIDSDINVGDVLFINGLDHYSQGKVIGITISAAGTLYVDSIESVGLTQSTASASTTGYGLTVNYKTTLGEVTEVTIQTPGIDYKRGEVFYLSIPQQGALGGGQDAKITITDVDDNPGTRLPDAWRVVQYNPPAAVLKPVYDEAVVKGLTSGGIFLTKYAENRWLSFGRTKITNSRLKNGIFRRSTLSNNIIENIDYDTTDRDFSNISNIKSLVLSDIVFNNTGNRMSRATYYNSSFYGGTDTWVDGIIYRSVLNMMTFNKGIIKESSWLNGTFSGGVFYKSNSYNAKPSPGIETYDTDRIRSSYKGGKSSTGYNDRHSWRNGSFEGGEFVKSDWESGVFNNGEFYSSKWYGGTARGGVFGNDFTATDETRFYNGVVDYTTVDNALFVADDSSRMGITNSIVWNNGIFNGGVFGSNRVYLKPATRTTKTYLFEGHEGTNNPALKPYPIFSYPIDQYLYVGFYSPDNIPDMTEFSIKFDISNDKIFGLPDTNISDLRIVLEFSGQRFLVKDFGTAPGDRMLATLTTDKSKPALETATYPYVGDYRMAISTDQLISGFAGGPFSDPADLLLSKNFSTFGNWNIEIISRSIIKSGLSIKMELNLVVDKPATDYIESSAVWNDGTFNAGQFVSYARWMNGVFNSGKFTSVKGWELSGSYSIAGPSTSHTWVNGVFNGGEFGNGSKGENSTWGNGEFREGIFSGRVWNNGLFKSGLFTGSGLTAAGGWIVNTVATSSNARNFVESFTHSFFGLWRNGLVTESDQIVVTNGGTWNTLGPGQNIVDNKKVVTMNNVLWMGGQFDHTNGSLSDSVWLSGTFSRGTFNNGTFNPFVKRPGQTDESFDDKAVWTGGKYLTGDFFYSEWKAGDFITGTGFGMWFRDGVAYYMNAINVTWGSTSSSPRWKNGNWDGSTFDYNGEITNPLFLAILRKSAERNHLMNLTEMNLYTNLHVWNIFEDLSGVDLKGLAVKAYEIETFLDKVTPIYTTSLGGFTDRELWVPPTVW